MVVLIRTFKIHLLKKRKKGKTMIKAKTKSHNLYPADTNTWMIDKRPT